MKTIELKEVTVKIGKRSEIEKYVDSSKSSIYLYSTKDSNKKDILLVDESCDVTKEVMTVLLQHKFNEIVSEAVEGNILGCEITDKMAEDLCSDFKKL